MIEPSPGTSAPAAPAETFRNSRGARLLLAIAFAAVAWAHLSSVPQTIWEYDESLFIMAVEKFQPLLHHPPPPGYPVYIGTAKLLAAATGLPPFVVLVAISCAATLAALLLFALAYGRMTGDARDGVLGATLLVVSPSLLISGTLPQSDAGATALLGATLLATVVALTRSGQGVGPAVAVAILAAATVGWRVQFVIFVAPLLLATFVFLRQAAKRIALVVAFGLACAAWFVPLVLLVGPTDFWPWLSSQATYFATHDADISRSGRSSIDLAFRFVAHPWGPKYLAGPVLLLAAAGLLVLVSRLRKTSDERLREPSFAAIAVVFAAVVYLGFEFLMMDPADAVRYTIPTLPAVALLAAFGTGVLRRSLRGLPVDVILLAVYGGMAWSYAAPILQARSSGPSPPVAAIAYLRSVAPPNAAVLFDLPLRPHAAHLLREYSRARVDEGLRSYGDRMDIPLFELTDSASKSPGARIFRWPITDAYGKLTRGHYGVTSVERVPDGQRMKAISGIFPLERNREGEWRWVGKRGVIELPPLDARTVTVTLMLPPTYPFAANTVRVIPEGGTPANVTLPRGGRSSVTVDVPPSRRIVLESEKSFVPSELPGTLSRDPRTLAVMLASVEQHVSAAAPAPASPELSPR